MLIKCPSCQTTYNVSDSLIKGSSPTFRCSRCKHTFALGTENESKEEIKTGAGSFPSSISTDEDREMTFVFPPHEREILVSEEDSAEEFPPSSNEDRHVVNESEEDKRPLESEHQSPSSRSNTSLESQSEANPDTIDESPRTESVGHEPVAAKEDPLSARTPTQDGEQAASTLPYLSMFGLLVIGFAVITAISLTRPQSAESVIKNIPLVGTSVLRNNHLKNGVVLQSLRSGSLTILGNREVFVVTGVASNHNPVAVREIRVTGRLYSDGGTELDQQEIWVGNAISPKIVRGMTVQDISDLQRLKPLRSFEIPAGESVSFTIVFQKPGKEIKEFSCEVLSVEGQS